MSNAFDDEDDYEDEEYYDEDREDNMFADPGGRSALRAATKSNPCIFPCPTCKQENVLTQKDVNLRYQCDSCADAAEGFSY